jgi:tetratricopeptide (TPR) repeat protein
MTELENYLNLLLGNGKAESAIKFLQTLIQEMPEQLALQRRLASLYAQRGNINEAVEQLDKIGRKLLQVGDHAGASEIVEAIIALNPPNKVEYQKFLMRLRGQKA